MTDQPDPQPNPGFPGGQYPPPTPPGYPPPGSPYPPPPGAPYPPPGAPYPPPGAPYPPPGGQYPPPGIPYPPTQSGWTPPAPGQPFTAGESWGWSWAQFRKRAAVLILAPLTWLAIFGVIGGIARAILSSHTQETSYYGPGMYTSDMFTQLSPGAIAALVVLYLILFVVGLYFGASQLAAHLDIADGKQVTYGSFFRARHFGAFVGASIVVSILTFIGVLLLVIPGIVFAFLAQYTLYFVVDRRLGIVDAIKASINLVTKNFVPVFLVWLISVGLAAAAAILNVVTFGLASFITVPVLVSFVGLLGTYTYRRLTGGVTAPPPV